jgi:hypothetical protein
MTTTIAPFQDIAGWERTLYAFLAEKERRSGSRRPQRRPRLTPPNASNSSGQRCRPQGRMASRVPLL